MALTPDDEEIAAIIRAGRTKNSDHSNGVAVRSGVDLYTLPGI